MAGISNLETLLKSMSPVLIPGNYVFCTLKTSFEQLKTDPILIFQEKEGITLVLEEKSAQKNKLKYEGIWAWITLNVHSDLAAVGFLASLLPKLAEEGISVNVISAYYHDHLFVPKDKAEKAMKILEKLTK